MEYFKENNLTGSAIYFQTIDEYVNKYFMSTFGVAIGRRDEASLP